MNGEEFLFFVALLCVIIDDSQNVAGQGAALISSFNIERGDFDCGENLICSGNATTNGQGLLKLTPDPRPRTENYTYFVDTMGVALYNQPVQLLDRTTSQVASFSVRFSFRIESGPDGPGDGMAFVMFADETWVGEAGGALGAFRSGGKAGVDTLAVEFDTFQNVEFDNGPNEVGIDTTSAFSVKATKVPFDLHLERVYAWMDYNSLTSTLAVYVGNAAEKPEKPSINYIMDPRDVFDVENVWVGFSGSNGNCPCFNYYTVYDLSFNSSFPSLLPPATPTPAHAPPGASQKSRSSVSTGLIAGVTVGVAGVVLGACLLLLCTWRKRKRKMRSRLISGVNDSPGDGAMAAHEFQLAGLSCSLRMYSYDELRAATADFSDALKLGEGGFGSVYRGSIRGTDPELLVAVKKVSKDSKQGEKEFLAEVSTIGMLRHRNLVQLLGWCCEGPGKYLLVYEFMPNGSLDRHLYPRLRTISQESGQESVLSWERRFKILGGLAAALQYLHEGWRQQVIHRDVKSSNVMLDDNFNAMLGDFGLARKADHYRKPATTAVAGTHGYIAPEASLTGKFTVKTDAYAFGAVCLEIVCGRKAYSADFNADEILLVDHVWKKLSEDELLSVVDINLEDNYDKQQVEVVLLLGLLCSHPGPDERPDMRRVGEILAGSVEIPPIPKNKPQAEYHSYSYREHRSRFLIPVSGTDASESGHRDQLYSSGSNSRYTASSSMDSHPRTKSSRTSGLTFSGEQFLPNSPISIRTNSKKFIPRVVHGHSSGRTMS